MQATPVEQGQANSSHVVCGDDAAAIVHHRPQNELAQPGCCFSSESLGERLLNTRQQQQQQQRLYPSHPGLCRLIPLLNKTYYELIECSTVYGNLSYFEPKIRSRVFCRWHHVTSISERWELVIVRCVRFVTKSFFAVEQR